MSQSVDLPSEDALNIQSLGLRTPERTCKKKYDFSKLEIVHTPIPKTTNIFNLLLQTSKHSSRKFLYQTPRRIQKSEEQKSHSCVNPKEHDDNQVIIAKKSQKVYTIKPKEAVKSCNCTRSNCLKKYCDCYKMGVGCSQHCNCYDCKNKQSSHTKIVAEIRCNCKKNECLKNYCECRQAGVGCSSKCGCIECKNDTQHIEIKETIKKRRKLE